MQKLARSSFLRLSANRTIFISNTSCTNEISHAYCTNTYVNPQANTGNLNEIKWLSYYPLIFLEKTVQYAQHYAAGVLLTDVPVTVSVPGVGETVTSMT